MRLLGQFQACLFFAKRFHTQKHVTSKMNHKNKTKQTLNNEDNNFLRVHKLLRGRKSFVLRCCSFLVHKIFL